MCYAGQIYCDFSGYSDMAIAVAGLLGYELCLNFNFPYFSRSITEFWQRWHISLSSWLRDYLYISLGGNRGTKLFTYRNLMLTMLLGGLWHGASWTFVIWGGLHGLALIVHREWHNRTKDSAAVQATMRWLAVPLTFYWVCTTWIMFRSQDVVENGKVVKEGWDIAARALRAFLLWDSGGGTRQIGTIWLWFLLAALAVVHFANSRKWLATWWRRVPAWTYFALLGMGWAMALFMKPTVYKQFIYFQF
jgi:alginate O-acetyltransferase complex protein AlgI